MHADIDILAVLCATAAGAILLALLLAIITEHGARPDFFSREGEAGYSHTTASPGRPG